MKTCDLPDGGRLAYVDRGTGDVPVVLLHPGHTDHTVWSREIDRLSERTRVIAPDARTHGASSDGTAPFRTCDDLAHLLRQADAAPAVLVGLSMGAAIALDTALEHPDVVRAVVVSGAGTGEPEFADPWAREILARVEAAVAGADPHAWLEAMLDFVPGPSRSLAEVDPEVVARIRRLHEQFVRDHIRPGLVPPTPVADSWERLPEVTVPVLGIVGSLDAPDHHRMCERAVAAVTDGHGVVTIEGAGHFTNLEQPQRWDQAVDDFLGSVGVRPPRVDRRRRSGSTR